MSIDIALIRCSNGVSTKCNETNITGMYPPLGLAYMASALKSSGLKVKILDLQVLKNTAKSVEEFLKKENPVIVGITSTTLGWPRVVSMAEKVKKLLPGTLILAGGPQLGIYPKESLSFDSIDVGVYGEGEKTIVKLVQRYLNGEEIISIKGTIQKKAGGVTVNPPRDLVQNLDELSFPAFELLPYNRYWALGMCKPVFAMVTSRGCPYSCSFCYRGPLMKYRQRSAGNIVEEMEIYVKKYNARELIIFDETFTINKQRTLDICRIIKKRKLIFKWNIRTRADLVDEELLRNLKEAGCYSVNIGVESGNQRILDKMNKGITIFQIKKAFKIANNLGLETRGYFMLGYLGESLRTIKKTVRFSKELGLDWASFSITIAHPGTDLYQFALKQGILKEDYWKKYTLGTEAGPAPYFVTNEYDEKKLRHIKNWAYLRFYLRLNFCLKKLVSIRALKQIKGLVLAAFRIYREK